MTQGALAQHIRPRLQSCNTGRQPKATQAERDFLLNPDSASLRSVVANTSHADGKMTPGPGSSVDHAFRETPSQEIPSSQMEPAASTPVLALPPENRNAAQA